MAENHILKQEADKLFALISVKDISGEDKEKAAAIIKENPNILTSPDFMEQVAPQNMNLCPQEGYTDFVANASKKQEMMVSVLDNLKSMSEEGLINNHKNGKTPVQYMLDEGRLPNGETIATQTVKNITFLRALRSDNQYSDKTGMKDLHDKSGALLHDIFAKEGYGANPNRRNEWGQKAGDIIESHLDTQSKMKKMSVANVKKQTSQLTVDQLREQAQRTLMSVDDLERLNKDNKKEGDVTERAGDVQVRNTERDKENFSKEDVVEYMYTKWFLSFFSHCFNKAEDAALGIIDGAAGVFIESCKRRSELNKKIKDKNIANAHKQLENFATVCQGTLNGRKSAYGHHAQEYQDIFTDLSAYITNPATHKPKYTYSPEFLDKLQKDENAKEFIKFGTKKINGNLKLMEAADKLALTISQIEMVNEFMSDKNAWKKNKNKEQKTNDELKQDLEARALKRQKSILKSVAIIEEDTRLLAEIAYHDMQNLSDSEKNQLIEQMINQEVNAYMQQLGKEVKSLEDKQKTEIDNNKFAIGGNKGPDLSIYSGVKVLDESIEGIVHKGKMYNKEMFSEEKSQEFIESKCSLFDEAVIQNKPSVYQRCQEYSQSQIDILVARRQQNNDRAQRLADFKKRFAMRDGTKTIDDRIIGYQKDVSRG